MKYSHVFRLVLAIIIIAASVAYTANPVKDKDGFIRIFDGKTLDGWEARAEGFWTVSNGAITGQTTKAKVAPVNQFITWKKGIVKDFELKLKFRFSGTPKANAGIQIRSKVDKNGHVVGYQADMNKAGQYIGMLYEEKGRGILAQRGTKVTIDASGRKHIEPLKHAPELKGTNKDNDWNDYHIIAKGNKIILKVNGLVTSILIDNQKKERALSGVIALQLHKGPPMKIEYKDILLKHLKPKSKDLKPQKTPKKK